MEEMKSNGSGVIDQPTIDSHAINGSIETRNC
jgi:hypothetical protein